jgi:hypothetical protein
MNREGSGKTMSTFLSKERIKIPSFSSKWFVGAFAFLVVVEFLDGLTTKIGLDLGLFEVGTYARVILGSYGFWGLMVWKYSIVAGVGALLFLFYIAVKKYAPTRLKYVNIILTVGCLTAALGSLQVVLNNIGQILLALHP